MVAAQHLDVGARSARFATQHNALGDTSSTTTRSNSTREHDRHAPATTSDLQNRTPIVVDVGQDHRRNLVGRFPRRIGIAVTGVERPRPQPFDQLVPKLGVCATAIHATDADPTHEAGRASTGNGRSERRARPLHSSVFVRCLDAPRVRDRVGCPARRGLGPHPALLRRDRAASPGVGRSDQRATAGTSPSNCSGCTGSSRCGTSGVRLVEIGVCCSTASEQRGTPWHLVAATGPGPRPADRRVRAPGSRRGPTETDWRYQHMTVYDVVVKRTDPEWVVTITEALRGLPDIVGAHGRLWPRLHAASTASVSIARRRPSRSSGAPARSSSPPRYRSPRASPSLRRRRVDPRAAWTRPGRHHGHVRRRLQRGLPALHAGIAEAGERVRASTGRSTSTAMDRG